MTRLKLTLLVVLALSLLGGLVAPDFAQSADTFSIRIETLDPPQSAELGSNEKLYVRIFYESDVPLRFQASAYRQGSLLEVGAVKNPAFLHAPGKGEALAWILFLNPTHVDKVRLQVFDAEWQPMAGVSSNTDVSWRGRQAEPPREPAEWVQSLLKKERLKQDFIYDPTPKENENLYDFFFLLSIVSIPAYLVLQVQMLRLYRGRWWELAAVPLISVIPWLVYTSVGYDIGSKFWIILIFRGGPFALAYLLFLWAVKRIKGQSPPGPSGL